jgi:hypothetical protein
MNASVIERLLETFFRRPWLYALPLVLCIAIGGNTAFSQPKTYTSVGVVSVSRDTLLSNLSNVGGDSFGFDTPASVTSRRINEQLRTDEFVRSVAEAAGLATALDSGVIRLSYIRAKVGASPDGESLLKVFAETEDPVVSARLAQATIDTFIQSVIDNDLGQSFVADEFYSELADGYLDQVETARQQVEEYLALHPEPTFGDRPTGEQTELAQLNSVLERAQARYTSALGKAEDARLATEQARIDVTQRIRVVDPPTEPEAPTAGLRAAAKSLIMFGVLGLLLSAGFVAVASFLDSTIRTTGDVRNGLGLDAVAKVPRVSIPRGARG